MAYSKEQLRAMHKAKQQEREGKRQQSAPEPEQGDPLTELNRTLAMLITELKNVQVRMADIAEAIGQSAAMKADRR
jgi:hypothetical protein